MRRLIVGVALLALAPVGCRHKKAAAPKEVDEDGVASVVNVTDARTSVQLTRGFYGVEANSWRWTMKSFAVALKPPKGADQKGATLQMTFSIPEAVLNKVGPITVAARVNGVDVAPQTFSHAGENTYRCDLPPNQLGSDVVPVDFLLDKSLPPSPQDSRELGIIVSTIGLTSK